MLGEQVLHHVRRLRALVGGEPLLAGVPVGHDGARLVAHAGVTAEHEGMLHHRVGVLEALVRIAGHMHALEAEVVAKLGMHHGGRGIERSFGVDEWLERLVFHIHQFAAVLCFGARARHNGADSFALPARAVHCDGVLRRRLEAFEVGQHADPGRDDLGEFGAGDHGDDAWRLLGVCSVDAFDLGVRVWRAHVSDVRHAWQHHVADELCTALREPRQVRPRHRAADVGVRPVERGEGGGVVFADFHFFPPRACATASIASTMAWYPVQRQ